MYRPSEVSIAAEQQADPYGDVALGVECAWPIAELERLAEPEAE